MDRESCIELLANVFELKTMALPKAQAEDFPITLATGDFSSVFQDVSTFITVATCELERIAVCVESAKLEVEQIRSFARS
jgi:hypothetical protein